MNKFVHKLSICIFTPLLSVVVVLACLTAQGQSVEFNQHIRPLLSNKCFACHGPDANQREAGLRLDLEASATAKLASGARAIVPGDLNQSEIWQRINSEDEFSRMPPKEHSNPLSSAEKQLIKQWIPQGAK